MKNTFRAKPLNCSVITHRSLPCQTWANSFYFLLLGTFHAVAALNKLGGAEHTVNARASMTPQLKSVQIHWHTSQSERQKEGLGF